MPYKKELHTITCPECGKVYQVYTAAYKKKLKDQKCGMKCQSCIARETMANMSDDAKQKAIETKRNFSDEKKQEMVAKRTAGTKKYWANMSKKDRQAISKKRSEDREIFLVNLSDQQMMIIGRKISSGKKKAYANLTPEERQRKHDERSKQSKAYIASLSPKKKKELDERLRENNRQFIQNMSDEERAKRSKQTSERNKEFWTNGDPEKIADRLAKLNVNGRKYWNGLSESESDELTRKRLSKSLGQNKLHQKFEEYFNSSTLVESYRLEHEVVTRNNNVVHSWDYGVYDKENTLVAIVDLDGAYFHADNVDYDGLHSKEEYDEARSQSIPDGVKHFIIQESNFGKCFEALLKSVMLNYDDYVEQIFNTLRSMPFPVPHYSDIDLVKSYAKLLSMRTDDKYHQDLSLNTRIGDRLIQHFHPSIYSAHRDGELSPYEAWHNDDLLKKCIRNRVIYQSYLNPNKILQGFNVSKIAPKVSVFSAGRAKLIIDRYLHDFDEVFDPFSGFSGRMLGAVSLGKDYFGSDISQIHVNETNKMIDFLHENGFGIQASVERHDVLSSSGVFQCLFTCPPYAEKEQWLDVPVTHMSCDDWIDECLKRFKCERYVFVVDHTEKYQDYIEYVFPNRSHMNTNNEFLIIIN